MAIAARSRGVQWPAGGTVGALFRGRTVGRGAAALQGLVVLGLRIVISPGDGRGGTRAAQLRRSR